MVTKGIITSIDFNGNTCQVRIPLFETAGNDPITGTAIVSNTPGSYNGYKVGDVVLVAFEDGKMQNPVIVGKLYLGAAKEKQDPRGTINVETTTASKSASLPADAVLTANVDSNVPNTNMPFGSLASIANNLNSLNTDVNQLDRFTRNQFNSVITDVNDQGEQLRSEIKQTAENIENKVVHKHKDGSQKALGWDLNDTEWKINAQDTVVNGVVKDINIVTIDRNGMSIAGDLKLNGYPKNIIVRYAQNGSDKDYPYLYKFKPDSFPDTKIDKTWYYNKYIKITEADKEKYILISSENIDDYTITPGETVAYVYNLEEINTEWKTETPARVDGQYIWQWTHTEIYSFDGDKWDEQDDDKVVCITGAKGDVGEQGISIKSQIIYYAMVDSDITHVEKPDYAPKGGSNQDNHVYGNSNGGNIIDLTAASPVKGYGWSVTPHEYIDGWNYYTSVLTIYSDDDQTVFPAINHRSFADPVKAQELDGVYELAQGKSKNYYSETNPAGTRGNDAYGLTMRKGYCWFDTGYTQISTPEAKSGYLGKWLRIQDANGDYVVKSGENPVRLIQWKDGITDQRYNMIKVGPDNIDTLISNKTIVVGTTEAFETGNLSQWDGTDWVDISGELVTNKLTANYINALDITAKKITVLDQSNNDKPLFEADGINGTGAVKIGNFKVDPYGLIFGEDDSSRQFSLKNFTTQLQAYTYSQPVPNNNDINVTMKVTLTKDNAYFKFFIDSLCSYGIEANHCIIISNLNTNSATTDPSSGEVYYTNNDNLYFTNYSDSDYTSHETVYGKVDNAIPIVFKNVKANDFFYITFRLNASLDPCYGHTISSQAIIYLPQNDTCAISDVQGRKSWMRDSSKDALVENTTLCIGNKFNVTDDGTLMARTGLFGPWMLSSEKLAYNYHDYTYNNKYKPYWSDADNIKKKYASAYKYNNAAYWNGDALILSTKKVLDKKTTGWEDYFGPQEVTVGTEISAGGGVESTRIVRKLWSDRLKSGIAGFKGFPVICNINNAVTISSNSKNAVNGKKDVVTTIDAICTFKVDGNNSYWTKLPRAAYANIVPFFGFIVKTNLNDYATISTAGVRIKTRNVADDDTTPIADTITEVEYSLAGSNAVHGTVVLFGKATGGLIGDN